MSLLRQSIANLGRNVLRLAPITYTGELQAVTTAHRAPRTCQDCRRGATWGKPSAANSVLHRWPKRRDFSCTALQKDGEPGETRRPIERIAALSPISTEPNTPASSSSSLPSHTANRRSDLSKRASQILDTLLARASLASQHINAYTGTDYSGIEALRKEITEQEQRVKVLHSTVDETRAKHHDALAKQTSAQREIVGLLERKSSWSPADLERYMSLVRSEHLNDQDVQVTKDNSRSAEHELEDGRSLLERLERKQYHEEQVWSDTIRRNSTWVTFGLMGVNILLLLAQIAIFEPYRRKKIVRDMKNALDEKTLPSVSSAVENESQKAQAITSPTVVPEQIEEDVNQPLDLVAPLTEQRAGVAPSSPGKVVLQDAAPDAPLSSNDHEQSLLLSSLPSQPRQPLVGSIVEACETYRQAFRDLFSERLINMRKIDVTKTALQGAATGVAITGLLVMLLRPR